MGSTSRLARGSACLEEDTNIPARTALAHHTLRHLASFECIVEPELVIEPEPANVRVSADPLDAGQVLDLGGRWGLDSWERLQGGPVCQSPAWVRARRAKTIREVGGEKRSKQQHGVCITGRTSGSLAITCN